MEFFENTSLIGWGVILGLWIGHKLNKALIRQYNARLRRALRRNVVADTINIDGNHSITRISINGIDVLKIFAEAEGRLKIKVIRGDGKPVQTEQEKLFADLDKPSLHALSYALRHPDTWPQNFVWRYSNCDQCAMGLAHSLWANKIPRAEVATGASIMAQAFAMPYKEANAIFLGSAYQDSHLFGLIKSQTEMKNITPEMVADQIDAYLTTAE